MNAAEARLELALVNARAQKLDWVDVAAGLSNAGLPPEVIFRLQELWDSTKMVAGKLVHMGKIILLHVLRFIEENPNLAVGIALGASLSALTGLIPVFGRANAGAHRDCSRRRHWRCRRAPAR
jgi:hypothetical protein